MSWPMLPVTASQIFLILILVLIPATLYLDATEHRIGKDPTKPGRPAAGVWAIWSLIPVIGPVIAMVYLIVRDDMIERAKYRPVVIPRRQRNRTYFLILAGSLTSYGLVIAHLDRSSAAQKNPHHETPFYLQRDRIDDDG
jgi:hypothetical protein